MNNVDKERQLNELKKKFRELLKSLKGENKTPFSTTVETGFEAVCLAEVMCEYKRKLGPEMTISPAESPINQKPGKYNKMKSYKISFQEKSFYFTTDVEVFGIEAFYSKLPRGVKFESDIVVIPECNVDEINNSFDNYPAPQHIDSAYECKFGKYSKGQLRELLGLRRHLSIFGKKSTEDAKDLFELKVSNSIPQIPIILFRPFDCSFFETTTSEMFDLKQIIVK